MLRPEPTDDQLAALVHLVRGGEIHAFYVPGDDLYFVVPQGVEAFLGKHSEAGELEWRVLEADRKSVV